MIEKVHKGLLVHNVNPSIFSEKKENTSYVLSTFAPGIGSYLYSHRTRTVLLFSSLVRLCCFFPEPLSFFSFRPKPSQDPFSYIITLSSVLKSWNRTKTEEVYFLRSLTRVILP